ncbi:hypothetical protein [Niveispirillum sp. KHB5.9]|uniref:hypothetical protein n=1 Tax=Niveispirillum sp. KHB5.9 TaxID=3400269 RepID=UPI003A8C4EF6
MARVRNPLIRMQTVTVLGPEPQDARGWNDLREALRRAGQHPSRLGMARIAAARPAKIVKWGRE